MKARGLPPVRVGEITRGNAAEVVSAWVKDGVTAVCTQSDEIALLVLYGIREAGSALPLRPRGDRRRRRTDG